ncbi:phage tail terminator family protein [Clostridium neonatale]|uniref:phage tail terminator family protein n=1 Tax=Clostridium neonatale TaxID=137838 RepID=UPI00374F1437
MISINDIRIAIQQALDNDYPNIEIYSESIEQGFEVPCFFVKLISSNQDKQLNNRYKQSLLFDVHYFSDKEEDLNKDCLDVADNLYRALEYVEIDGHKYRALKMNHKVTDGVLHFMLKFNYNILKVIEYKKMKELEVNVSGK